MDFEIPQTEAEGARRAADFARTRAAELGRMGDLDGAALRDLLASAERAGAGAGSMKAARPMMTYTVRGDSSVSQMAKPSITARPGPQPQSQRGPLPAR